MITLIIIGLLALLWTLAPCDPYEDRPGSHLHHHLTGEGPDCGCPQ